MDRNTIGYDPYNNGNEQPEPRAWWREPRPASTPGQVREAEQILACYETELELAQ